MLFNSAAFALFLPMMLAVYWRLQGSSRRWALLVGSYFFYAWWDWRFTGLLILSTLVDFHCARAMTDDCPKVRRKRLLATSIVTNLGILATFKYFNFFRDSADALLAGLGVSTSLPMFDVALPMGISFYTFQTMSYTIDVYRGGKSEHVLRDFAIFVACFPQLVAGPIVRAKELLPQIKSDRRFADVDLSAGVYRIFRGLFKKMVVADTLALYVDMVFADPTGFPGLSAWIAMYAYAFQIYMDFSGYTDVALGVGHLLGLKLPENFNRPYLAASPSQFWRRWHITLSTWLRDYLYIPLGGSRLSRLLTMRNVVITMTLGGLWHGAAWTFVAWGVYHSVLLIGERTWTWVRGEGERPPLPVAYRALKVLGMFHLTCMGWLLFRAPDWTTVASMLHSLSDFSAQPVYGKRILLIVAACALAHVLPSAKALGQRFAQLPAISQGALAATCMWTLVLLGPARSPFIYFQF